VRLNLRDAEEVKAVYEDMTAKISATGAKIEGVLVQAMAPSKGREVILGMNRDPQFGPVLMFGLGGIYVEALKDVSFRLAPILELDARNMVEGVRTFTLLKGVRGEKPADLNVIIECLQRLSQLSCEQPLIKEIDINPLLVYAEGAGAHALDARIILNPS
jgi:acyl-CoA synthetase (NDP forming)